MADDDQLRAARPTVNLKGQDDAALSQGLLSLSIVERTDGLYRCDARFANWGPKDNATDFLYFDRRTFDFGGAFKIKVGDDVIFDGRITGLEAHFPSGAQPELAVLAEDRLQDLRMTRRTRTFADTTDASVFQSIASDYGLTPSVSLDGPQHAVLAQVNQSDLAFMRDRARSLGAELWMDGTTLYAKKRSDRGADTTTLGWPRELHSFVVLADLAHQRTAVIASGWDVSSKQAISHEAGSSVVSGEVGGDTSGASILQEKLGERKDVLAHASPLNESEAQARAEAHYRLIARRFVVGRGVAETSSKLRVGNLVALQGLGALFSGNYYLSEVRHLFDGVEGLRTEFTAERPAIGQAQ